MGLKKREKFLIITDKKKKGIALVFLEEAQKISDKCKLIEIPIGKIHGEEPHANAAKELKNSDVALLITTISLSHTKARKNACKAGARIASMPGITPDIIKRCVDVDYNKILRLNKKLCKILTRGRAVLVENKLGTRLSFSIKGRKCLDDNGIYDKKGRFGNLPAGEACLAPLEGTTNGRLVVDKGCGKVKIIIDIVNGQIVKIKGRAPKLRKIIKNKRYANVAEFGIGSNPKARAKGTTLEDEKVLGTAHIAFGNNISFGGRLNVPFHLDCVFSKPTVFIDGKLIAKNGKIF
ncbi:aminopeptidase [Candidatus Woesearchaeota archaeon]|nr:aminopeptidase [Candidatus Woesearchaeota archaeon]